MSQYETRKVHVSELVISQVWEKKSDYDAGQLDTSHIPLEIQGYSDNPAEEVSVAVFDEDTYIMGAWFKANVLNVINGNCRVVAGKKALNEDGSPKGAFDGYIPCRVFVNPTAKEVETMSINQIVAQPKTQHVIRHAVNVIIGFFKPQDFKAHRQEWGIALFKSYGAQISRAKVLDRALDAPYTGKAKKDYDALIEEGKSEADANIIMVAKSRAVGLLQVVIGLALLPTFVLDQILKVYFFSGDKKEAILGMPAEFAIGKDGEKKAPGTWKSLKDVLSAYGTKVLEIEETLAVRSKNLNYRMDRHEPDPEFLELLMSECPELEYFQDPENWVGETIADLLESQGAVIETEDNKWIPKSTKDIRELMEKLKSATMATIFACLEKDANGLNAKILDQAFLELEEDSEDYKDKMQGIIDLSEDEAEAEEQAS